MTDLTDWNKMNRLNKMESKMNEMLSDFFQTPRYLVPISDFKEMKISMLKANTDMYETDEEIVAKFDLPGVEKKDINLEFSNGSLKVKVTSELVNSDQIFDYLQLKDSSSSFKNVSDFSTNVTTKKTVYLRLDLRNFNIDLEESILNHNGDIRFIAMAA